MRIAAALLVSLSLLPFSASAWENSTDARAAPMAQKENILIVGNSFVYYHCGLSQYLYGLMKSAGKNPGRIRIAAISGSNMTEHSVENLVLPQKDSSLEKTPPLKYKWVLLQASNRNKGAQERNAVFLTKHFEAVRKSGAEPVLISTWIPDKLHLDKEEIIGKIQTLGAKENVLVIPVWKAFSLSREANPEIRLLMRDGTHPSAAGSYLMAATIYASLFGENPEAGISFPGGCEKPLPMEIRKKLCQAAYTAAQEWRSGALGSPESSGEQNENGQKLQAP